MPSLLDPEDMADCDEEEGPDKFSVVTYVSQFYHLFKDSDDSRNSAIILQAFESNVRLRWCRSMFLLHLQGGRAHLLAKKLMLTSNKGKVLIAKRNFKF